jgi:hypothetical protein
MKQKSRLLLVVCSVPLFFAASLFASGNPGARKTLSPSDAKVQQDRFSIKDDMAFVSVWGNRPDAEKLQGFQRAVLFNARGEVVKRLDLGRDSIYSLDRMIQENRTKGPLFIRMYRR